MERREFLKGVIALPAAALPAIASEWGHEVWQDDPLSHWWNVRMLHRPTGVRYGYRVSEQYLVNMGLSIDGFVRRMQGSVNPYYASRVERATVEVG